MSQKKKKTAEKTQDKGDMIIKSLGEIKDILESLLIIELYKNGVNKHPIARKIKSHTSRVTNILAGVERIEFPKKTKDKSS